MHDKNGTELRVGDIVMIPARVTQLSPTDEYCNVQVETVHGRRPDGMKETVYAINTAVLILHDRAAT